MTTATATSTTTARVEIQNQTPTHHNRPMTMDTRILTTFPTEGQPSPRIITPPTNLTHLPIRPPAPPGRHAASSTQLNRWFCCRCAERGYNDPVGMVNHSDSASSHDPTSSPSTNLVPPPHPPSSQQCWQPPCNHTKCNNCLASPNYNICDAIRTFGGLHTSPRFIDPVFWECPCGEWAGNPFSEAQATMGISLCSGAGCEFRYRRGGNAGGGGTLQPDSVVLNVYGARLGTADQTVVFMGGPWDWQRRGLGPGGGAGGGGANVLIGAFRVTPGQRRGSTHGIPKVPGVGVGGSGQGQGQGRRILPPMMTSPPGLPASSVVIWREGEPAPRYPYRPPPPTWTSRAGPPTRIARPGESAPTTTGTARRSHAVDGIDESDPQEVAYRMAYLAGIPSEPSRRADHDVVVTGVGIVDRGNAGANARVPQPLPMVVSAPAPTPGPVPTRGHLNSSSSANSGRFLGSVGVADHVQIQMDMQMQSPGQSLGQTQGGRGSFSRWG